MYENGVLAEELQCQKREARGINTRVQKEVRGAVATRTGRGGEREEKKRGGVELA